MTDRAALLAAILAQPDEDTPRLAFADLVEEDGDGEWAAFIRSQIEGRAGGEWDAVLARRAADWFPGIPGDAVRTNPADWSAVAVPPYFASTAFEPPVVLRALVARGFVAAVACRFRVYRRRAPELFGPHPIARVVLSDKWPHHIADTTRIPAAVRPPGPFAWLSDEVPENDIDSPAVLPGDWVRNMTRWDMGKTGRGFPARWFATADEAQAALSELCVAFGRRAGLSGELP